MQSNFSCSWKNDILADSPPMMAETRPHIRKLTFNDSPALTRTTEDPEDFQIDFNCFSQHTQSSSTFSSNSSMCFKKLCFDFAEKTDNAGVSINFQDKFSVQPTGESESLPPLHFPDDLSENTQMLLEEEEDQVEEPVTRKSMRRWTYQEDEKDCDFQDIPNFNPFGTRRCASYQTVSSNFGEPLGLVRTRTNPSSQEIETDNLPQNQEPVLPLSANLRDPDLWTISPQTLVNLMNDPTKRYLVIDCRYDYEYKGGHIKDAVNIDALETLERLFLSHRQLLCDDYYLNKIKFDLQNLLLTSHLIEPLNLNSDSSEPPILIFHCEFSQKRGPRALRALRNLDRRLNAHRWPGLHYPQVYLLEEGYQNFHKQFPEYCTPENSYVRMLDKNYRKEYAEAREKERKVWKKSAALKPTLGSTNTFIQRSRTFSIF